ncbi:MAG: uroporphyrinogen-III synthase [Thermoproteus sp.]|jgi:uroporphyrinogen-III synthase|nr:uroporphyrinogen-III synthase [Thermoproteus sp.]MDT7881529.1 uroporphyrinogen-III synthase [Thermoproteus sp.]
MRIAVTSPGAIPVFKAVAKGMEVVEAPMVQLVENPLDVAAVAEALERCDAVVFATGRAAYRLADEAKGAGLYEKIRGLVARMKVATVEGEKGAVMVRNAFGVRPAVVASTVEELRLEGCRCAAVFHYGTRDEELLARVGCSYVEFFPYRALPGGRESVAKILSSDAAVFTSALAVQYFAEVGGPQAVRELAKKLVVAGGPGVSRALAQLGVPHVVAPSGRLGPLAQYVVNLARERAEGSSDRRPVA